MGVCMCGDHVEPPAKKTQVRKPGLTFKGVMLAVSVLDYGCL